MSLVLWERSHIQVATMTMSQTVHFIIVFPYLKLIPIFQTRQYQTKWLPVMRHTRKNITSRILRNAGGNNRKGLLPIWKKMRLFQIHKKEDPLSLVLSRGYPYLQTGQGYPPRQEGGIPHKGQGGISLDRTGSTPLPRTHRLCRGQYASCGYAGGLPCYYFWSISMLEKKFTSEQYCLRRKNIGFIVHLLLSYHFYRCQLEPPQDRRRSVWPMQTDRPVTAGMLNFVCEGSKIQFSRLYHPLYCFLYHYFWDTCIGYSCFQIYFLIGHHCKTQSELIVTVENSQ